MTIGCSAVQPRCRETRPQSHRLDAARSFGFAAAALTALVMAVSFANEPAFAGDCFRYGEIVTLSGHYASAVLPGADGVVRDLRTNAGRRADLLSLDSPLCVDADVLSGGVAGAMTVQVHCPVRDAADGSALSLTGRLLGADTGNGHTPVLLVCRN